MSEHDWVDDGTDPDAVDVRHVQPYEAVKEYRCPGCDHEIRVGEGHKVVVPRGTQGEHRHWHTGCWHREERRRR
ncbi:MAG: hypothetical protein SGJ13_03900 [Actinomycetota bacterium]|nr:hypothetical protein [Actinomycetota bacterium]